MGALFMLAVTAGLFLLLRSFVPTYLAVLLAVAFLVGWFKLNVGAGMRGLARANLRAYFISRQRGASHHDALTQMVASRYPLSEERAMRVLSQFALTSHGLSERDQLRALVFAVFVEENGFPPAPVATKVQENIDHELSRQSMSHGVSL